MAPDARGPAGDGRASDDDNDNEQRQDTPREPPPPNVLDLGDGQVWCIGTAADMRAAADWLHRNYPEHSSDPPTGYIGPVFNMMVHRSRLASDFAKLANETLRDERLSLAARGHLAYLLSLPNGWNTTADAEAKRARQLRGRRGEGRDAMRRIYAELKNAGYIRYVRTQDNGVWSTEIHVFDRPSTDVRLTDIPETRMSVPPAETPEPVDNPPDTFSQVAPMYGSPGVGNHAVGNHAVGNHVIPKKTEPQKTEDEDLIGDGIFVGVGDLIADKEQPNANSLTRVHVGPGNDGPDAQQIPHHIPESPAADRYARASETGAQANGNGSGRAGANGTSGGAGGIIAQNDVGVDAPQHPGPVSELAKPASSDATKRPAGWRSPQQIAADQVAEARAGREAADRAAAVTL